MIAKMLLDQGLPRSAAELLRNDGIDAMHTGEVGLATADDSLILSRADAEDRIVVTLDADFHKLIALTGATRPSVIRVRIKGLRGDALARLILAVLQSCRDDLIHGCADLGSGARCSNPAPAPAQAVLKGLLQAFTFSSGPFTQTAPGPLPWRRR